MDSPRVKRRSGILHHKRKTNPSDGDKALNSTIKSFEQTMSSGFDSGILNDSDIELGELDLSDIIAQTKTSPSMKEDSYPTLPTNNGDLLTLKQKIRNQLEKNTASSTPIIQRKETSAVTPSQSKALLDFENEKKKQQVFFGLPDRVRELLQEHRGIKDLYAWQVECLTLPAVNKGSNLIYSLPTSGGKTLVAEILVLKELLCRKKDVLFILPFVSIVQEKVRHLGPFGLDLDFLVEEYAGSRGKLPPTPRRNRRSIFVATIEKGHSIVNSLIEAKRMDSLGLVVVDELHMIGEGGQRGATLEMTLTKVLATSDSTRIVGMSATLTNISELTKFLNAELYTNDFRPVELKEHVKLDSNLYEIKNQKGLSLSEKLVHARSTSYQYTRTARQQDPDQIVGLVSEVIPAHSCLIFCPTKRQCESLARQIADLLPHPEDTTSNTALDTINKREALLVSLQLDTEGSICPVLANTVPRGVAYHHGGLTHEERHSIEEAYSEGLLRLLCCTSTLAAGVNLPAKRVIIRSPYVGQSFLSSSQYKQMVGRAGRAGFDTSGESILILNPEDKQKFAELLTSTSQNCTSSLLYDNGKGLRQFALSIVALEIANTMAALFSRVMERTLFHVQSLADTWSVTKDALQSLLDVGLLSQTKADDGQWTLKASSLGRAVVRGSLDLDRAKQIFSDLSSAQESLNMTSYLHLIYLTTPYDLAETLNPDWTIYFEKLNTLSQSESSVLNMIGFNDSYIARKASGQRIRKKLDEFPLRRFFLSLMLYDLWRGQSLWTVSDRYRQSRGLTQQLVQSASSLAACLGYFVTEFEQFWCYQALLPNFAQKLTHCVSAELLPLMEVSGVKRARARQLYDLGYQSLSAVASADPSVLVRSVDHLTRRAALQMISSARMLVKEKAEALREEADQLMLTGIPQASTVTIETPLVKNCVEQDDCWSEEEDDIFA